jgi:Phosphopantetheine attachment site
VSGPAERVERLLAVAREVLAAPDVPADGVLTDHGGTSLSIARILAVAAVRLGLDIDLRDLRGAVTVRNLAAATRAPDPPAPAVGAGAEGP